MFVSGNATAGDTSTDNVATGGMVNLNCVDMPIELQRSFHGLRRVPLFYFDYCKKINRKNKVQRRVILMTLDHLYVCHPNGDILRCFPFHLVTRIIHDSVRYQLALIVPSEYDLVIEVPDTFHMINVFSTLRGLHPFDEPLEIELVRRRLRSGFQSTIAGGSYQPPSILTSVGTKGAVEASVDDDPFFSQLGGYTTSTAADGPTSGNGVVKKSNNPGSPKRKGGNVSGGSPNRRVGDDAAAMEAEDREARNERLEEFDGKGGDNDEDADEDVALSAAAAASAPSSGSSGSAAGSSRKGAIAVKLSDWWFYAKQAIPYLQRLPPGVIPNWNQQYYRSLNQEDRIRDSPEYRLKYERSLLFKLLFRKEKQSRLDIYHEREAYSHDNDPFVYGDNIAGHANEVCIGRPPYTVRSAKPEGFRLCLYTGDVVNGDEGEEFDVQD